MPQVAWNARGPETDWEHGIFPTLVLVFALAAIATTAAAQNPGVPSTSPQATAKAPPPSLPSTPDTKLVRVELADMVRAEGERACALLLFDAEKARVLPLFVESSAAGRLEDAMRAQPHPPGLAGLAADALTHLGAELDRVELRLGDDGAVKALAIFTHDDEELPIEARPEAVLEWGLSAKKPVFAAASLMDARAIAKSQAARPASGLPTNLRCPEHL